jgi:hypothetical protein
MFLEACCHVRILHSETRGWSGLTVGIIILVLGIAKLGFICLETA